MSVLRRVALVLSLVLVVGLTVGYFFRRAQMTEHRNLELTAVAERTADRVVTLIDRVEAIALAGSEPDVALAALMQPGDIGGACVRSATAEVCSDTLPQPTLSELSEADQRRGGRDVVTAVATPDGVVAIKSGGARLSIVVKIPGALLVPAADGPQVWITDALPIGVTLNRHLVADGVRQAAVVVPGTPGLYAVASTTDALELPSVEANLFLVLGVLAAVLLMLAGATAFIDQRTLVERASTDQLTRLPNRGEFERRVADLILQSERTGRGFALLLFDLDGFKQVNDTFGHQAGDEVLQSVAARLAGGIRGGDLVARWGGDEFVVAMVGVTDAAMGQRRGGEIAAMIGGRTRIDSARESVRVGASVGVAFWPRHGDTLPSLLESADAAMYRAKRSGIVCEVAVDADAAPITNGV